MLLVLGLVVGVTVDDSIVVGLAVMVLVLELVVGVTVESAADGIRVATGCPKDEGTADGVGLGVGCPVSECTGEEVWRGNFGPESSDSDELILIALLFDVLEFDPFEDSEELLLLPLPLLYFLPVNNLPFPRKRMPFRTNKFGWPPWVTSNNRRSKRILMIPE